MTDHPYKPFNDAVKNIQPKPKEAPGPANPYDARDKDNADYRHKPPTFGIAGTSRQGPPGSVGYRKQEIIQIIRGDPAKEGWVHGLLMDGSGYGFSAKLASAPSLYGLDGGRIERLALRLENGYVSAFYNHGWQVQPELFRDQQALEKIQDYLDGRDREFAPIVPRSPDKDHGHER